MTPMASSTDRETYVRLNGVFVPPSVGDETVSAVRPLCLEIGRGEFLSVVGPRRCGKDLLLRMIAGLDPVISGNIEFYDEDGPEVRRVGYVFREPLLLPWRSVLENVMLEAEILRLDRRSLEQRASRLLASLALEGLEDCRVLELQPEQARCVSICRALLCNPSLLLMDDPFSSMDFGAREDAVAAFQRLWMESRFAVVLATSDISEAVQLADRVMLMAPDPPRILRILEIDLPRPRRLDKTTTPLITDYANRVRTIFHAEAMPL